MRFEQASQTSAGISPRAISRANSQQPAQNPTTDSSVAKINSTLTSTVAEQVRAEHQGTDRGHAWSG